MNSTTHTSGNTEQSVKPQAVPFLTESDLRDYFAAKACQGLIAGAMADGSSWEKGAELHIAAAAYQVADAMLAAREVSK